MKGCWERGGQAGRGSADNCSRILASHGAAIYKHSQSRPIPKVKTLTSLPCLLAGFLQVVSKCASGVFKSLKIFLHWAIQILMAMHEYSVKE